MLKEEINIELEYLKKAFLKPEIIKSKWWVMETETDVIVWPENLCLDAHLLSDFEKKKLFHIKESEEIVSFELKEGYGARLNAPGSLDATKWCIFDKRDDAAEYLIGLYY